MLPGPTAHLGVSTCPGGCGYEVEVGPTLSRICGVSEKVGLTFDPVRPWVTPKGLDKSLLDRGPPHTMSVSLPPGTEGGCRSVSLPSSDPPVATPEAFRRPTSLNG